MTDDVVVIGAGVSGLTTAVCLAEAGLDVRVDTAQPAPATTSARAGAMWDPYLVERLGRVREWSRVSLDGFRALARDPAATGVRLLDGTHESRTACDLPDWADLVDARVCAPGDLRPGFTTGWRYRAPVIDMPRYLAYLTDRLLRAGVRIRLRAYASLADALPTARAVVNCSGSGARHLVPDPAVSPVRGQLVVVENPGIGTFFADDTPDADELVYIFPHGDTVVLGGTAEHGHWDPRQDERAAGAIVRRCASVEPLLRDARVIGRLVGFRPVRPVVRLEEERSPSGRLLHNYGHGGAGVTLSWGCAGEILRMFLSTA
jgi:D-amino-acid oxidase